MYHIQLQSHYSAAEEEQQTIMIEFAIEFVIEFAIECEGPHMRKYEESLGLPSNPKMASTLHGL